MPLSKEIARKAAKMAAVGAVGGGASFLLGGALMGTCVTLLGEVIGDETSLLQRVADNTLDGAFSSLVGLASQRNQNPDLQQAFLAALENGLKDLRRKLRLSRGSEQGGRSPLWKNRNKLSNAEEDAFETWFETISKAYTERAESRKLLESDQDLTKIDFDAQEQGIGGEAVIDRLLGQIHLCPPRLERDLQEKFPDLFNTAWEKVIRSKRYESAYKELRNKISLHLSEVTLEILSQQKASLKNTEVNTEELKGAALSHADSLHRIEKRLSRIHKLVREYEKRNESIHFQTDVKPASSLTNDLTDLFGIYSSSTDSQERSQSAEKIQELLRAGEATALKMKDYSTFIQREGRGSMEDLVSRLKDQTGRIVFIDAAGGTGKTTFVKESVGRLVGHGKPFVSCIWQSAKLKSLFGTTESLREDYLTADEFIKHVLRRVGLGELTASADQGKQIDAAKERLEDWPFLLVADNLETAHDPKEIMRILERLSGRSRAIITTRERLQPEGLSHELTFFALRAFKGDEIRAYVKQRAELVDSGDRRMVSSLTKPSDIALERIESATGGNPLFMNVVVGQVASGTHLFNALDSIELGKSEVFEPYEYIYGPLYDKLENERWELEKSILQNLATIGIERNGVLHEDLTATLPYFSSNQLSIAIKRLDRMNWIDRYLGETEETTRYDMHPLAQEFIRKISR